LSEINKSFNAEPLNSLEAAKDALSNELEQLRHLVHKEALEAIFEQIHDKIAEQIENRNRFAVAIEKKSKKNPGKGKAEKAAAEVYAIRCAIAHAGTKDIFYEQFTDAVTSVSGVLPLLEEAVLTYLGIVPA
jgi:t-SNARE complex subunit (syntaxin)